MMVTYHGKEDYIDVLNMNNTYLIYGFINIGSHRYIQCILYIYIYIYIYIYNIYIGTTLTNILKNTLNMNNTYIIYGFINIGIIGIYVYIYTYIL